jgi:hypothetical protein
MAEASNSTSLAYSIYAVLVKEGFDNKKAHPPGGVDGLCRDMPDGIKDESILSFSKIPNWNLREKVE